MAKPQQADCQLFTSFVNNNVAIVGAGFAGLASAFQLLNHTPSLKVTLFHAEGESASSISTGLLHSYPGEHARKSFEADIAMREALYLLDYASDSLGQSVYQKTGVFRPCLLEKQRGSFQKTVEHNSEVIWWEKEKVQEFLPDFTPFPGLFIPNALTVDSALYLKGLLACCQKMGLSLSKKRIDSLDELADFDRIIIAAGAGSLAFFPSLPLSITKGQALLCRLPPGKTLPFSVSGKGHISCLKENLCFLGSTYERDYKDAAPDLLKALSLKELIGSYYPLARDLEVLKCQAGLRIARKGTYLPLLQRMSERISIFTGLGSRGLLYHALFAKRLAISFV